MLATATDRPFDAEMLRARVGQCRLVRHVRWHAVVGSTNDEARRLGRSGAGDGTLIGADEQRAGRGRRNRRWESPAGLGLYCSVLLRPPVPDPDYAAAVQLGAGVALAESLEPYLPDPVELLWPNDCLCRGQKLAGVLVEAETTGDVVEFLVCGMGVNLGQRREDFPPQLRQIATSMLLLGGRVPAREELLARLLASLEAWDDVARVSGLDPVMRRWQRLAPMAHGARVELETAAGPVHGISDGLSAHGALRVRTAGGVREVFAGELVRVWRRT